MILRRLNNRDLLLSCQINSYILELCDLDPILKDKILQYFSKLPERKKWDIIEILSRNIKSKSSLLSLLNKILTLKNKDYLDLGLKGIAKRVVELGETFSTPLESSIKFGLEIKDKINNEKLEQIFMSYVILELVERYNTKKDILILFDLARKWNSDQKYMDFIINITQKLAKANNLELSVRINEILLKEFNNHFKYYRNLREIINIFLNRARSIVQIKAIVEEFLKTGIKKNKETTDRDYILGDIIRKVLTLGDFDFAIFLAGLLETNFSKSINYVGNIREL